MNDTEADVARPEPPAPPGDGYEWVVVPDDPEEWALAEEGATCRGQGPKPAVGRPRAHGVPAVVRHKLGLSRRVWWNFCPDHADGRWAEDGVVVHWERKPVSGP